MTLELKDRFNFNFILFYAMGVLTLVPTHFFNTANDYWMYKFRNTSVPFVANVSDSDRTTLQANFTSSFSIVCSVSLLIFLGVTAIGLRRFACHKRIFIGLACMTTFFLINILFIVLDTDSYQTAFFGISMVIAICLSASASLTMMSVFQLVTKFPVTYTSSVMSGQAICGILAAIAQIAALGLDTNPTTTALVYFGFGTLLVFLTGVSFFISYKTSPYFQYHMNLQIETKPPTINKAILLEVYQKIKWFILAMLLTMGAGVMMQPGVTSLVVSVDKGNGNLWNDKMFVPVVTYLLYNAFDFIGREVAKIRMFKNPFIVLTGSVLRLSLIPLLLLCNEQPRDHLPVVFDQDYQYIILEIAFGLTHGIFLNMCILTIPTVPKPEHKEVATLVLLLFSIVIAGVCSFLSLVMIEIL